MTAFVQLFSCRLARARLVEREKEHAALGAEALFVAGRVPAKGKAFRREHDELSAGLGDRVAASLFERAHEGGEPCTAGADSRGGFDRGVPGVAVLGGCAVAFEGRYDGHAQYRGVAVGKPSAAEKLHRLYALEKPRVGFSRPCARGVFANVAAKGGELAVALHNPVMPGGGENLKAVAAAFGKTLALYGGWAPGGVLLRRAAALHNPPIFFREFARELPYENRQRFLDRDIFYLHHQMKVVGHDGEGRDFIEAAPLEMKAFYGLGEGLCQIVFYEALGPDLGKRLKPLKPFKGNHIEIGRLVVKSFEANHGDILPYYYERREA